MALLKTCFEKEFFSLCFGPGFIVLCFTFIALFFTDKLECSWSLIFALCLQRDVLLYRLTYKLLMTGAQGIIDTIFEFNIVVISLEDTLS